jgi:hypothetical protein
MPSVATTLSSRYGPIDGGMDGGDDWCEVQDECGDGREIDGLVDGRGAGVRIGLTTMVGWSADSAPCPASSAADASSSTVQGYHLWAKPWIVPVLRPPLKVRPRLTKWF